MRTVFYSTSRLRLWLACVMLFASLALAALAVMINLYEIPEPVTWALAFVALPGLYGTIVLGASPHGGTFGDWRDFIVVPMVSGVFWGTALWGLVVTLRAVMRRPAA